MSSLKLNLVQQSKPRATKEVDSIPCQEYKLSLVEAKDLVYE